MSNMSDKLSWLHGSPIFSALTDEQLKRLQSSISMCKLSQGAHLFSQGEEAKSFYLLLSGQVRLYRLSPSGQEKVVELVNPGQTFAEALIFQDLPTYPLNAQALVDSELLVISGNGFVELLSGSVESCFKVMASLSMRLRKLLGEIDALTLQNSGLRVANYLLHLRDEENMEVKLPAAKQVIASRLSIQPETFSRTLHALSDSGLIEVDGQVIRFLDIEALRNYSS